ncbi:MAG: ribosome recycling factor [Flavobacteriales bacterium]|nr:ribosome recycling factor [Flavobacteriales bacterium]
MPVQDIVKASSDLMKQSVEHLEQQFAKVRTGRASAALVDSVRVDYYGSPTPISQVGGISTPDARTLVIQPWDAGTVSAIEKAILAANLGLTPQSDGQIIRITVPPLTEERRKDIVKQCKKMAEDAKLAVRNVRRDANEDLRKAEKTEHFSEDERKRGEDDVQKNTDRFVKDIDHLLAEKEQQVMNE